MDAVLRIAHGISLSPKINIRSSWKYTDPLGHVSTADSFPACRRACGCPPAWCSPLPAPSEWGGIRNAKQNDPRTE